MTTAAIHTFVPDGFRTGPGAKERIVTQEEAVAYFDLVSLDTLTTGHMSSRQQQQFAGLVDRVREWRRQARITPGLSFILMSQQVGIGKTHIARAVVASYSALIGELVFLDDKPLFSLERRARFYTARELINILGGDNALPLFEIVPTHVNALVIDDLGREGYLDYVKADQQQQEKQARYFHLINHLYERRNGRFPVSVFITTNLNQTAVIDLLGAAVWSRLLEMCPRGYIVELTGLDDYRRVKSGRFSPDK